MKMVFGKCILFLTIALKFCEGDPVAFEICGGTLLDVIGVSISGCSSTGCNFDTNQTRTLTIQLKAGNIRIESLETEAQVIVGTQFAYDLVLAPRDPCIILKCPLDENISAVYVGDVTMTDLFQLPGTKLLRWFAKNKYVTDFLTCIQVPITTTL